MAIIDKIQLSGTVYTIGNETTTAVTSASTDNEIPTAKAVYDAIPQGGGGKAVSGGTNISITTGETADTINCTLPITASNRSIICGGYGNELLGQSTDSIIAGRNNKLYNYATAAFGHYNICSQEDSSFNFGYSGNTLFSIGNGSGMWSRHNALDIRDNGDIYIADTNDTSTSNYYQKPMIKLQDALGGGGASYSAGTGIDITNDVISVSGVSHNSLADGTKMLLKGDVTSVGQNYSSIGFDYYYGTSSNKNSITIKPLTINGNSALRTNALSISVVETSAITTSVTSSSTDAQVPSAKSVHDKLGGLSLVKLTQSEYDALATKDSNTLYIING